MRLRGVLESEESSDSLDSASESGDKSWDPLGIGWHFFDGVVKASPDSSGGGGSLELLAPSSGDCASNSLLLLIDVQ